MHCSSLVVQYSHARYNSYFYQLFECCWFFGLVFSLPVISWIEPTGGGQAGGGGGWEAEGGLKQPFGLKQQCCALSMGPEPVQSTGGGQDCRQEQLSTPCSPINAPQGREMHPRGFTASVKSRL